MSLESYYQILCQNGHISHVNPFDHWQGWRCPICDEQMAWINLVDHTNGSFDEDNNRIDGHIELETLKETKCKECGYIKEITFKIPESGGRRINGSNI